MQELIPINVLIADRTYRVKINSGDEEAVRKALKVINDKIFEYKNQFAGKDMQDYIAMVILWYATQAGEAGAPGNLDKESAGSLLKLEQLLAAE
jgi:hypothetical protein